MLLASHLVDDDDLGPAALAVARQHVTPDGLVIAEVVPARARLAGGGRATSELGPVGITITRARVDGDQLDAAVRYDLDGRTWDQPFTRGCSTSATLEARLDGAGLRLERWIDRERWLGSIARPVLDQDAGVGWMSAMSADHGQ